MNNLGVLEIVHMNAMTSGTLVAWDLLLSFQYKAWSVQIPTPEKGILTAVKPCCLPPAFWWELFKKREDTSSAVSWWFTPAWRMLYLWEKKVIFFLEDKSSPDLMLFALLALG